MPDKSFDQAVRFRTVMTPDGAVFLPLVTVVFIQPGGFRLAVPLLFDTGASRTTLRADLYPILGATAWDDGVAQDVETAGDSNVAQCYRYDNVTMEILGKTIVGSVDLIQMPPNPLYSGLLGRETIFEQFGFGFWESTHELLVCSNP